MAPEPSKQFRTIPKNTPSDVDSREDAAALKINNNKSITAIRNGLK